MFFNFKKVLFSFVCFIFACLLSASVRCALNNARLYKINETIKSRLAGSRNRGGEKALNFFRTFRRATAAALLAHG